MSEFRIVKRSDIPGASKDRLSAKASTPNARLHKGGTLFLSVLAIEPLGVDADCYVLAEFDEQSSVLKLSVPETLPRGVSESDCFTLRVRKLKGSHRPMGMINMKPLLKYIGLKINGGYRFEIAGVDTEEHSISLVLPMDEASHAAADAIA